MTIPRTERLPGGPPSHICVLGAGAVGGGVGALLHEAGARVTLVARGAHLRAMQAHGLRLLTPDGARTVPVAASDVVRADASLILLAVKAPQVADALPMLPPGRPVVCLQNGITVSGRVAAAGHPTIAAMIYLPATHLELGEVRLHGAPSPGAIDVGPYTPGTAPLAERFAATLRTAGLESVCRPDIMAWKRGKLLVNLASGLTAAFGEADPALHRRLIAEATAIYTAHALDWVPPEAVRVRAAIESRPACGKPRVGPSIGQSLERGRTPESAAIYGDLVALGRQVGIAAPLCAHLDALIATLKSPGSADPTPLYAVLDDPPCR